MAPKVQVLGATFTEDASMQMMGFMMKVSPNFPVGMSTREAVLKFLGAVDDGNQMPRLVLVDAKGILRKSIGWRDDVFSDPASQEGKLFNAVRSIADPRPSAKPVPKAH